MSISLSSKHIWKVRNILVSKSVHISELLCTYKLKNVITLKNKSLSQTTVEEIFYFMLNL